jgi:hypothetical protein
MRVRTHFFIIAMREEISRMNHCDEEEAIEILMDLSPFEMKTLMRQILTSAEHCKGSSGSPSSKWPSSPKTPTASFPIASTLIIRCQSAGYLAGNYNRNPKAISRKFLYQEMVMKRTCRDSHLDAALT